MGKQQKLIKGLPLLALMMFGALSIMATGCGGGGGNDGDGTTITQQTLIATWDITASHSQGITQSGTILLSDGEELTYNLVQLISNPPGQRPIILIGTGTWTLNESSLTLTFDTGVVYQATAQGNSTNFSMDCSNGWTLNFSRK